MTDELNVPGNPPSGDGQQTPSSPAPAGQVPAGYVEQSRLTGALQKIEQLTLANKALAEASIAKDATIGQLQAKVTTSEASVAASAGEHTNAILALTKERDDLKVQVALSEATKMKIKLIGELGRPELFSIIDSIPNAADEATQKDVIEKLGKFAVDIAKQREQQLVAGGVPAPGNPQGAGEVLPTTDAEWSKHVNSLALGSPERQVAMDRYFTWINTPHTP